MLKGSPLRSDWSTAGHVSMCSLFIANWCLSRLWCVGRLPGPQLPACFETCKSLFNQFSSVPSILATSAAEEALWQRSRRGRGRPDPALMQDWKGGGGNNKKASYYIYPNLQLTGCTRHNDLLFTPLAAELQPSRRQGPRLETGEMQLLQRHHLVVTVFLGLFTSLGRECRAIKWAINEARRRLGKACVPLRCTLYGAVTADLYQGRRRSLQRWGQQRSGTPKIDPPPLSGFLIFLFIFSGFFFFLGAKS